MNLDQEERTLSKAAANAEANSTSLATRPVPELTPAEELDLVQAGVGTIDADDLLVPMLKLGQGLSREVSEGDARAGQFINSLTGEAKDGPVELVLVSYKRGRFFSPEGSSEAHISFDDVAPDNWPAEYAGQHFADLPDAEEQYSALANSGQIEWGSGPPIRTTYNYVGFETGDPDLPVRISLQRTSKQAAKKLNTLLRAAPQPWAFTFELSSVAKDNAKGKFYVVTVKRGRKTNEDEQARAVDLARSIQAVDVRYHGDDVEAKPSAKVEQPADALAV